MDKNLEGILESLNPEEMKLVLAQLKKNNDRKAKEHQHHFSNKHVKIGYISDTHIGHKCFDEALFDKARVWMKKQGVEAVYHPGDIIEGMSGRDGHIYELDKVGISPQLEYAAQLFSNWSMPVYAILGNHDEWASKKMNMGVDVGTELEGRCKGIKILGQSEADVSLSPHVSLKLYHGGDGSAYASSYKLQKLIESFEGGKKPNIVFSGHYHKALYMFNRSVHGFECGTICGQTPFMRGKKLAAHKGFGIVDVYMDKTGVDRIVHEFTPAYD